MFSFLICLYYWNIVTEWKVYVFGVFLVRIFQHSDWMLRDTPYSVRIQFVSCRIQSECGKMRTRKTSNTDTFHAVSVKSVFKILSESKMDREVNYFHKMLNFRCLTGFFWIRKNINSWKIILSWRRLLSYRNQSIDLLRKSMDWFLYDIGLCHERINGDGIWWFAGNSLSRNFLKAHSKVWYHFWQLKSL